jgi:hypothetical protein
MTLRSCHTPFNNSLFAFKKRIIAINRFAWPDPDAKLFLQSDASVFLTYKVEFSIIHSSKSEFYQKTLN